MGDPVARLAFYYSRDAEVWERRLASLLHPLGLRLLERLSRDGIRVVLDLGTGTGTLLPAIAARTPKALVVGIDRAEGMVRRADPSFARAVADAARLPLADASVDAAVLAFMLFHPPRAGRGPSRGPPSITARRGLGRGHVDRSGPRGQRRMAQILDAHGARPDDVPARHDLMDTPEKLDGLLRRAGFETISTAIEREPDVMDLEEFLWRRTKVGAWGRRFRSLPEEARKACLAVARGRLAGPSIPGTSPIRRRPCWPGPTSLSEPTSRFESSDDRPVLGAIVVLRGRNRA